MCRVTAHKHIKAGVATLIPPTNASQVDSHSHLYTPRQSQLTMNLTHPQDSFTLAGRQNRRRQNKPESGAAQPAPGARFKVTTLCPQRDFGKAPMVVRLEDIPEWFNLT